MTTKYIQPGSVIDHTPAGAVAAGAVVVMSTLVGVALVAIAANATGSVQIDGVFELNKLSTDVIAQGDVVYWDPTPGEITTTASTNTLAGKAIAAAGNGVLTVKVKLNV